MGMKMDPSDHSLVDGALRGDAQAFGTLVTRHYDRIFRLAWRLTGSRDAAQDLAQDVCAALPGKLAGFRREAAFTSWLHRVVVNAARDAHRRAATHARAAQGWGDVERLRRADAADAREAQDWLTRAMTDLPEDLRETVALVLGEDLTHAAAAEVLELSEGTVSWRMSEVRRRLRALAEKERTL